MFTQNRGETIPRTIRPAGQNDAPPVGLHRANMRDHGFKDIGVFISALWREIATQMTARIENALFFRHSKGRDFDADFLVQSFAPIFRREIKSGGRQRLIG